MVIFLQLRAELHLERMIWLVDQPQHQLGALRKQQNRFPHCTTYHWAAIADPMLYSSIGIGYRFGRTPEILGYESHLQHRQPDRRLDVQQ